MLIAIALFFCKSKSEPCGMPNAEQNFLRQEFKGDKAKHWRNSNTYFKTLNQNVSYVCLVCWLFLTILSHQ